MAERVLVTGSAGNVGCNVIRRLRLSDSVEAIVGVDPVGAHPLDPSLADEVPVYAFDLRDQAAFIRVLETERITVVVHLAGVMGTWVNENPLHNFEVNLGVSGLLFDACRETGVNRVLYASSKAVYEALKPVKGGWSEERVAPSRPYAIAKYAAERLGRVIAGQGDFGFVALRFADFLGVEQLKRPPGRRGAAKTLTKIVAAGIYGTPIRIKSAGSTLIDPMYTPDLGDAIVALSTADDVSHSAYNVGAGWPGETYTSLVEALQERYGDGVYELRDSDATVYHSVGSGDRVVTANRGVLDSARLHRELSDKIRPFGEFLPKLESDIQADRSAGLLPAKGGEWLEEKGLIEHV